MRSYSEARDNGEAVLDVDRLRQTTEAQFQAINCYELKAPGGPAESSL